MSVSLSDKIVVDDDKLMIITQKPDSQKDLIWKAKLKKLVSNSPPVYKQIVTSAPAMIL